MIVTASIVLFQNNHKTLSKAIDSILNSDSQIILLLIDNSPTDELSFFAVKDKVFYYHLNKNIGFGAAHNFAFDKSFILGSDYHFVINPDVHFQSTILREMVEFMSTDTAIGMLMPRILNEDGSEQFLPKLLPTPWRMFLRKVKRPNSLYSSMISEYELRDYVSSVVMNIPVLSGCFTLFRTSHLKNVGGYDERFFMYMEDWDLSRRMHQHFKTIYLPSVSIYHGYESGANSNIRLFLIFVRSCILYFNKWGWFFDFQRSSINEQLLKSIGFKK
jgi:GT2 family glycosyltransferase